MEKVRKSEENKEVRMKDILKKKAIAERLYKFF